MLEKTFFKSEMSYKNLGTIENVLNHKAVKNIWCWIKFSKWIWEIQKIVQIQNVEYPPK